MPNQGLQPTGFSAAATNRRLSPDVSNSKSVTYMKNIVIDAEKISPKDFSLEESTVVSMGEIAFGGNLLGAEPFLAPDSAIHEATKVRFALSIAAISHIITQIVLSDRLAYFYEFDSKPGPSDNLQPLLEKHCRTLSINHRNSIFLPIDKKLNDNLSELFDSDLVTEFRDSVNEYVPWASDDLHIAWLAEYAKSKALQLSFSPNPFISKSLGVQEIKGSATAEMLVKYIESLRSETVKEFNLLKQNNIYDLQLPSIFAAALRESNSPADLINVASQMNGDAKHFRRWSKNLDGTADPKKYVEQFNEAKDVLYRLGAQLNVGTAARMQISSPIDPGLGIKLSSTGIKKMMDWLDVDIKFIRPRHYLLNLLSSARQISSLSREISRVFSVPYDFAKSATDYYLILANHNVKKTPPK